MSRHTCTRPAWHDGWHEDGKFAWTEDDGDPSEVFMVTIEDHRAAFGPRDEDVWEDEDDYPCGDSVVVTRECVGFFVREEQQ